MAMEKDWFTQRISFYMEQVRPLAASPGGGVTRLPFTPQARRTADYLLQIMREIGMSVREDEAGNVFGTLSGTGHTGKSILVGSHFDSVTEGGNFDGMAGIISGIVIAESMKQFGWSLADDFTVVGFCDEEGTRFGTGFFGSCALLGELDKNALRTCCDREGVSIAEAMKCYGKDPEKIGTAKIPYEDIRRFIEIHIEQGPVLEQMHKEIGIVHTIVGMRRFYVSLKGRCDHAGTTPMNMRKDPVPAAARLIDDFLRAGAEMGDGTTATVGWLETRPGAVNIIPSEAVFSLDFRSVEEENLDILERRFRELAQKLVQADGLGFEMTEKLRVPPTRMDRALVDALADYCRQKQISAMRMPSGAGHDSLPIAQKVPAAMLFVPSKDGRSHCAEEWTDYSQIGCAAQLLAEFLSLTD